MVVARWYLPCEDGEMVSTKIARKLGRDVDPVRDKGYQSDGDCLSQAPTRVQSELPSRAMSSEKVERDQPERMV